VAAVVVASTGVQARDQIRIVSSSTVYPFASAVAEQFGKTSGFKTPVVESTGSGGAFKLFCAGLDLGSPDIAGASRRIAPSEMATCQANGVDDIAEVKIGFDGIVVANAKSGQPIALTLEQLYRALAKQVPLDGKLVPNPYKRWNEIGANLPNLPISILGPAPNHGTRDILTELVMDASCRRFPEIAALSAAAMKQACGAIREDGAFIDVTGDYIVTLRKLAADPQAVGILTYSYLDQNGDKIQGATIDGQAATYDNILSGRYRLSRPLFIYVKKAHLPLIPGIKEYISEFTSEGAWGTNGYLSDRGLVVMPDAQRKAEAAKAADLPSLRR
jgi:phosphate transport system substrate-binding protein